MISIFLDRFLKVCLVSEFHCFADPCSAGYDYRTGSNLGGITDIATNLSLSRQDCANKCNANDTCLSFEHSIAKALCYLHRSRYPIQQPFEDYVFCAKLG